MLAKNDIEMISPRPDVSLIGEKRSASAPVRFLVRRKWDKLVSAVLTYKSLLIIADGAATFPLREPSSVVPVGFVGTGQRSERTSEKKNAQERKQRFAILLRGHSFSDARKATSLSRRIE